jgi:hypothetical protein
MGEQNALLLSQHNSLVSIISQALGGGSKKGSGPKDPGVKDVGSGHASPEAAAMAINAMLLG